MSTRKIEEWALPVLTKFRTYIDIGANDGDTAIPFLDKFQKIIAFEPNPHTFNQLSQNKKIESHNVALGSFSGKTQLVLPFENKPVWGSTSSLRYTQWENTVSYEVEMKKLDEYNFTEIDFIKIDVEQAEMAVILGSIETIKNQKPVIMFENKRNENQCVIDFLSELGYSIKKYKSDTIAYYKDTI
jgi:FkbM family methyltransferase